MISMSVPATEVKNALDCNVRAHLSVLSVKNVTERGKSMHQTLLIK